MYSKFNIFPKGGDDISGNNDLKIRWGEMKYFVLAKRNTVPLPIFSELGGGFAITNADSHEEVTDSLLEYPLYPFFNWEVKPLSDWSHSYDKLAELFQRITK